MVKRLLLSLMLVFVLSIGAVATDVFNDVPADHWAYNSVKKLVDAGILTGFPDGQFKGDALLTRYEMATYTARAIDYMVSNVDRMNRTQAAVITRTLEQLVDEFNRELTMLALDTRALNLELDKLKSTLEPWVINASMTVEAESTTVNGFAYEDPFATVLKPVVSEADIETRMDTRASGRLRGYDVEFVWSGTGTWDAIADQYYTAVDRMRLAAYGKGHTVVAGTLDDVKYNDFILNEDDQVIFGLNASVDTGMFNTDRLNITFANYLGTTTRGVLATEAAKSVLDWNVKAFAGVAMDAGSAENFIENTVLGVNAALDRGEYSVNATYARDKAGHVSTVFGFGYNAIESLDLELKYTNIELGFAGVLASVDPEKTLVAKGTIDLTDHLSVYFEGARDYNGPEGIESKIGARMVQYPLLPGLKVDGDVYHVSDLAKQVIGFSAETGFSLGPIAQVRLGYASEDGNASLKAELSGGHQVGPFVVDGSIKYQSKPQGSFAKYHLGLTKTLSDVTSVGVKYDAAEYVDANDVANDFDVKRFIFYMTTSF